MAGAGETASYYIVTITSVMLYRPDISGSGTLQMPDVLIGVVSTHIAPLWPLNVSRVQGRGRQTSIIQK